MDEKVVGASLVDQIKLLGEWYPLIAKVQVAISTKDPHDRAVGIVECLLWCAGKSQTEIDDEALEHIEAILKSPEGASAFDWAVAKIEGLSK
jgi:hypothetical protein